LPIPNGIVNIPVTIKMNFQSAIGRLFILGLMVGSSTLQCLAQAPGCEPLRIGNPAGNYIIPGTMGQIVYRRVDGQELEMDAYVQKGGGRRPAVVIVHGGGWDTGSRRAFTGQMMDSLTFAGFNWFTIDYRKSGLKGYREGVEDLIAAVDFIRCHAGELGTDPTRIAFLGEDSGAHIAAMASFERTGQARALVSIGGYYDLTRSAQLANRLGGMTKEESDSFLRRISPAESKRTPFPATLVIHGTADNESPLSAARSFCAGVSNCRLIEVEGASHRPENWWPSQWGYKKEMIEWLKDRLDGHSLRHQPHEGGPTRNIIYDAGNNLKMDAWLPSGKGPHPAVIIVHGGGWEAGDKVTYVTPLFEPLARAGFAWFSIDYRLTVRHPRQMEDLRNAVRFVAANAGRFRIDPRKIAVIGESASGQMAALLATEKMAEVAAVVSFYGVYDFMAMAREITPRSIPTRLFGITSMDDEAAATLRGYSPIERASADQTPILIICGDRDGLYGQHIAFVDKLRKIGARFEEMTVEGAPHGIENWEGHPERLGYKQRMVEWLASIFPVEKQR